MRTAAERVNEWIDEQMDLGKTRDDMNNTHFILGKDSVAILKKSGRQGFDLKILYPPFTVDFTEDE